MYVHKIHSETEIEMYKNGMHVSATKVYYYISDTW